ncbi:hypothetical protein ACFL51_01885 [Myxococcota bacterium]
MPIPIHHLLIETLLRHLATHPEGMKAADAYEAVADDVGLTKEDREQLLPSDYWRNTIHAIDLVAAGILDPSGQEVLPE